MSVLQSLRVFARDVAHGLFEISHNMLALLGLGVLAGVIFAAGDVSTRARLETQLFSWLQVRHESRVLASGDVITLAADAQAVSRATAANPAELPKPQAAVAGWLARRYRVAPQPVARLVQEAWSIGAQAKLDPTLILAIMAVESSFNPFAQSSVGAQGLMQVMTRVHDDKYEAFGGTHAAFDPVTNLRVGVQVLRDCIERAGSVEAGLRQYVGATTENDGGYATKVLAEQALLRTVSAGKRVSPSAPALAPQVAML